MSEIHGNPIVDSTGQLAKACNNNQAVLTSEKETEGSSGNGGFLRRKLNKVVLAYSGGLDTSVIVPWLRENYGCEVVCFTADVGQGISELEGLEAKAKASGACQLVVKDLKEEFVRDYIFPCLRAGAIYERKYLLGTSMARPVIAKAMVDVAREVGADAVSHGCTGKGNDQVRFELTFFALNPELNVVAPWREWEIRGREDAIEYAKKHNVPVPVTKKSIYSRDRNLWHLSHEGDILEDPAKEPNKDMYMMTVEPEDAPNQPEYVQIGMVSGLPVSVIGKEFSPASLLSEVNEIGGHIIFFLFKNLTMMSFIDCMVDPRTCINVTQCIVQLGKTISKVSPGSLNASGSSSSNEQHNQQYTVPEVKRRKQHRRKNFENQEPCLMRGVYFKNMKWQTAIKVDKKQIHLGTVGSQEAAACLYDRYG